MHDTGQDIVIDVQALAQVPKFKYLGTTVTNNNRMDDEINTRMANASRSFGRLKQKVWFNKDLTVKTNCAVYIAIVISALLYMFLRNGMYTRWQHTNSIDS